MGFWFRDSSCQHHREGDFLGVGREVEAAAVLCGEADGVDLLRAETGRGIVEVPVRHLVVAAIRAEGEELIVGGISGQAVDAERNSRRGVEVVEGGGVEPACGVPAPPAAWNSAAESTRREVLSRSTLR